MKRKKLYLFLLVFVFFLGLSGCKKTEERNGASAIFYLNGGTCQNNSHRIINYYDNAKEGEEVYIANPGTLYRNEITRDGYVLEGWYRTMNDNATSFQDKWDFEKDKMGHDGVNLYARWVPNIVYSFDLYYRDAPDKLIHSYKVKSEGTKFSDYLNKSVRPNYTCIGFEDEFGNKGNDIVHPGGEQSLAVKVYADYIEGSYRVVSTARELAAAKSENIYLTADIDFGGDEFKFSDYTKLFVGNGHKISNFKIVANPVDIEADLEGNNTIGNIYVSIFHQIKGATIENVSFENVEFLIEKDATRVQNVYFAPLAAKIENSKIQNVQVSGTVSVTIKKPCELVFDRLYYLMDNSIISSDSSVSVTLKNQN